jgi:hypothetical protein
MERTIIPFPRRIIKDDSARFEYVISWVGVIKNVFISRPNISKFVWLSTIIISHFLVLQFPGK